MSDRWEWRRVWWPRPGVEVVYHFGSSVCAKSFQPLRWIEAIDRDMLIGAFIRGVTDLILRFRDLPIEPPSWEEYLAS